MPRSSEGGDKPHPYWMYAALLHSAARRGWVYPSPTNSGQDSKQKNRSCGVYPRPANSGQDTKQIPRSSEGGDKPHPYVGCVLQMSYYQRFAEK